VIGHAVLLYFRFHLNVRDVQDLLAECGLIVSHEAIRRWCDTFGPTFAAGCASGAHGQATGGTATKC
jgi:putative transposase